MRNGIESINEAKSMPGDNASRNGLLTSRFVDSVSVADVVCNRRGKSTSRRAVRSASARGTNENKRNLKDSQ